ncbi:DMT family transporter [Bacillus methanolicus]|uniref:DMT family transporter n=1 Tax=Bacillus methanolicus TaxID=1471 RepID=UPI00237FDAC8|nr:DMT family transporter [Bacillus methanolicus]
MISKKYAYILLVLANMIWGGNFVIGRIAGDYLPPITFSLLRWLIAFLFLTPFLIKKLKADLKILWSHKWVLLFLTVTGISGYNTIIYFALHYTTSINASVVNSTTPMFIAVFSVFILKERLSLIQAAGIGLSILGIVFILSKGSIESLETLSFNMGDLFVLVAVICWSLYSIIIKKYSTILPAFTTLYVTSFLGVIILFPLSMFELNQPGVSVLFTPNSILILFYVGILASIVAFLSWNSGVSIVGAAKSGIFLNLLPVFAALFATTFTKESLLWYQIIGGCIVIIGVLLSSKTSPKVN